MSDIAAENSQIPRPPVQPELFGTVNASGGNDLDGADDSVGTILPEQWRLERIEVVNWGTFHGFHQVDVARQGYLLTGHSGSGKSSLVDAIAAVLTPQFKTHFNAAAADGARRGSDRTILSYVRGAWSRAADDDTGEISTKFLRTGATWSAILLRYNDGGGHAPLNLVRLFHVTKGATRPADVASVNVLVPGEVSLPEFEDCIRNGIDTRRIKTTFESASIDRKQSAFLSKVTRRLGLGGETALVLLHRTQSAKNLGTLDALFRDYMLDEPETFAQARIATEQFVDLQQAHAAVTTAREQIGALSPLVDEIERYTSTGERLKRIATLIDHLPSYMLHWKIELATAERDRLHADADQAAQAVAHAEQSHGQAERAVEAAAKQVEASGGGLIEGLERDLAAAAREVAIATDQFEDVADQLRGVGLDAPESASQLADLQRAAQTAIDGHDRATADADKQLTEVVGRRAKLQAEHDQVGREIEALVRSGSNIGADLVAARELICNATGLKPTDLPFAAQLVEVRREYQDWSGAIERVLAPISTVMLVPETCIPSVRAAANATNLGTRLRFENVPEGSSTSDGKPDRDTVAGRLDYAEHPLAGWLRSRINDRFAVTCVQSQAELRDVQQGVTVEGLVKRSAHSYEKNDRYDVADRSRWVLGFSSEAKIDLLRSRLDAINTQLTSLNRAKTKLDQEREEAHSRLAVLRRIGKLEWTRIDVASRAADLSAARKLRDEALAANGDLRLARKHLDDANSELARSDAALRQAIEEHAGIRNRLTALTSEIAEFTGQESSEVPAEVAGELAAAFKAKQVERRITHNRVDHLGNQVQLSLTDERERVADARAGAVRKVERIQQSFRDRWQALASDLTADIADRDGYLAILTTLQRDDLPRHEHRFFEMLTEQSRQNIGVLALTIRRAPREIRERIDPINESLRRSEFDDGRYLEIEVKVARSTAAEEFLQDLSEITQALTGDLTDRAQLEARFDTLNRLMTALRPGGSPAETAWRLQVLDTRRHVRFIAREINEDGDIVNVHDSSAGLSGGQKQKLVVFCLAAALRYQLAPEGTDVPRYGSIVMDEAFDKADADFTRMAMNIFVEFGFHMILATPLKLLRTLEPYIGGISLVTCRDHKSSSVAQIADIGWLAEDVRSGDE